MHGVVAVHRDGQAVRAGRGVGVRLAGHAVQGDPGVDAPAVAALSLTVPETVCEGTAVSAKSLVRSVPSGRSRVPRSWSA